MSAGHHHDEHHSMEQKPVSFTVPFFMAVAFLLALVLFLSLCDPKPHSHSQDHSPAETEHSHGSDAGHH